MTTPLIAVTPGDINGIGPEVTIKALQKANLTIPILLLAPPAIYDYYARKCGIRFDFTAEVDDISQITRPGVYFLREYSESYNLMPKPGTLTVEAGRLSMDAIARATELCINNPGVAMVTAPISKEAINLAGYHIPGHTEYLAEQDENEDFVMMLASSTLRIIPLSAHIPLSKVSDAITKEEIIHKLRVINQSLKNDFGIDVPRIAVLGLNPHAGDGGVLGMEEIEIIKPAMEAAYKQKIHCEGPFPADGFFGAKRYADFDAVLAMYHDQGLIPFKTLSFNRGINFTAGLSFIRTSPDHGTAYGIAGLNLADYGSMLEALEMAQFLLKRKKQLANNHLK